MGYQTVKSVSKAIAILELLTSQTITRKTLTLSEVAKATGILPATARNLLRTLEECGYAHRVKHGRYREGERCLKLFRMEGILRKLGDAAEPVIRQTVADIDESLLLVSLIKNKRVELLRCQAPHDTMVAPQWQANANYYRMRTTRAILAWLSSSQLEAFVEENGLPSKEDWPECENAREPLTEELASIRQRGGCCDEHGQYCAIAVPILTAGNEVVASLGCYSLQSRTDKPRAEGLFKMLQDCAIDIQEKMAI